MYRQLVARGVDKRRVLRSVLYRLQLLPHLKRRRVSCLWVEGAGPKHYLPKPALGIHRRRRLLASHALGKGRLPLAVGDRLRRLRQEGQAVVVQQPVEHYAQRVDVHAEAVLASPVDLRSHVAVRTLLGQTGHGALNGPGNAEVPQLEIPVVGDEDILRLDVPVDDVVFLAQLQRPAHVDAQADDIPAAEGVIVGVLKQRSEQLHPDKNIPAHAVAVGDDFMILAADHVGGPLDPAHQGEFPNNVLHHAVKIPVDALVIHALLPGGFQLRLALGHGDHLQRGAVHLSEVLPPDLVHRAEAALADLPFNAPFAQHDSAGSICSRHVSIPLTPLLNIPHAISVRLRPARVLPKAVPPMSYVCFICGSISS